MSALARAKVDAIIISAAPRQTASLAAVAHSRQLDVPIATNSPGFAPHLLETPAGEGLVNLYNVTSFVPNGAETPAAQKLADAYRRSSRRSGARRLRIRRGAGLRRDPQEACANKDLSRTGLATALRQLRNVVTGGVIVPLDYSKKGRPGSRQTYISRPDKSVEGGLKILKEPFASDAAKA